MWCITPKQRTLRKKRKGSETGILGSWHIIVEKNPSWGRECFADTYNGEVHNSCTINHEPSGKVRKYIAPYLFTFIAPFLFTFTFILDRNGEIGKEDGDKEGKQMNDFCSTVLSLVVLPLCRWNGDQGACTWILGYCNNVHSSR